MEGHQKVHDEPRGQDTLFESGLHEFLLYGLDIKCEEMLVFY